MELRRYWQIMDIPLRNINFGTVQPPTCDPECVSTIDPYVEDFTELDLDRAMTAMRDFSRLWNEAKDLKSQISRMEKDLNG